MNLSLSRTRTIARREYIATVRRKAFLFTVVGTPVLYALLFAIMLKPQISERVNALKQFQAMGVVDSSGAFANAPRATETELTLGNPFSVSRAPEKPTVFRTEVRFYPDFASADRSLRGGLVHQVLVIPADYMQTGALRRYARKSNLFTAMDERVVSRWLVRSLLARVADSARAERAARPLAAAELYTLSRQGDFERKDTGREDLEFLLTLAFGLVLGLSIVVGGQYLLQGVNEEKESRILESVLCAASPEELLAGKLLGLGAAGLTVFLAWMAMGAMLGGPAGAFLQSHVRPGLLLAMAAFFLAGYLFFGALMIGIGAVASNMREAQQFSVWFTFILFMPFYLLPTLVGHPDSPLAVALSLFPMTAPVAAMLRLTAPGAAVPPWQIAASLAILTGSAWLVLIASARLFRVGMLMYGKTPNLPEILRWIRRG